MCHSNYCSPEIWADCSQCQEMLNNSDDHLLVRCHECWKMQRHLKSLAEFARLMEEQ